MKQPKKSGWLGIFFFAFSAPLRSLVSGYINVMLLLILQLESTLSRIPTQKMTKRSKEDKVLWTCFVFLRGLFIRGLRIIASKFAHVYAMKQSAKIFVSTDLGPFCVLLLFCLFVWNLPQWGTVPGQNLDRIAMSKTVQACPWLTTNWI